MNYLKPNLDNLSLQEYKLYARHLILPEIQVDGQRRLKNAKILCIGAGALGSINLLYLVACGIGQIGIVDYDQVELSNLHRQIIYNYNDVGEKKVISAEHMLNNLNKQCKIKTYDTKINNSNAYHMIKPYDLIIDSTDNFDSRHTISQACRNLHKIHVYGAVYGFEGQISIFNYQGGPHYQDLYKQTYINRFQTCQHGGILGIIPGMIGLIQATETIKIIIGLGEILNNIILVYNSVNMSFKKIPFNIYNKYLKNIDFTTATNHYINYYYTHYINIHELNKILASTNISIYTIDIRNHNEYALFHIQGSINIPLYKFTFNKNIHTLKINTHEKHIIIYCNNNQKTIIISEILQKAQIHHWILYNYINPC